MSATYNFVPSNQTAPPFQFVYAISGARYVFSVFWNVYGQRWYFSIVQQGSSTPLLTAPMVGSDASATPINLIWALFGSNAWLYYFPGTETIQVGP